MLLVTNLVNINELLFRIKL